MKWLKVEGIAGLMVAVLLIGGCEGKGKSVDTVGSSGHSSVQSASPAVLTDPTEAPSTAQITANPADIKDFLQNNKIPNGDIFLQDSTVHVNIVGLNPTVEDSFAARFTTGSYILHNVKYTTQELDAAYKLFMEQDLHRRLNLYSSWMDVQQNKIGITLPDDQAEAAKKEIETIIAADMLFYDIDVLDEAHLDGTIVEIEQNPVVRILILEPDHTDPTYWYSFNEFSVITDDQGKTIGVSDLKKGQRVKLWSTGMVLDSLPAQATVRRLELEKK